MFLMHLKKIQETIILSLFLEQMMLERVKEKNNNDADDYLGITFARMGNIFDLERDFLSHYYTQGIIGTVLLVGPYVILLLACIVGILLSFKKITMRNTFMLLGVGLAICSAWFTGNVLDGLVVTLILGTIAGQLLRGVYCKNETCSAEN